VEIVPVKGRAAMLDEIKKRAKGKTLIDQYEPKLRGTVNDALFLEARRKKDAEEVRRIVEASKRVEVLYRLLEKEIRPGRTELEIAGEVMRLATAHGLSPLAAEGSLSPIIIASGPNGALPHAELSTRKVRSGDMVVADIFYRYRGYCTDCTRTYGVGTISKDAREGYQAVLEAQLEGVALTKANAVAKEVHAGVSAALRKRGLEKRFTHGTGHGVGIDLHEQPEVAAASTDVLAEGDVVTVEPGIYVPGDFGVRIEDTLSIRRGVRNMYSYTKELLVL
jgi:Xaa-Pro aminopeptidase